VSTFLPVEVTCEACGSAQMESLATSLNVTRTPEWKERVLDGSFQVVTCNSCTHTWEAVEPFVYIDFRRRLYVGVYPGSAETVWWIHERDPADAFVRNLGWAAPPVARPVGEGFVVRTVFGLAALREKVIALEASLDDVALEILKLRLMLSRTDMPLDVGSRPRLVRVDEASLFFMSLGAEFPLKRSEYLAVVGDPELSELVYPFLAGHPYCDAGRILTPEPALWS
jgi:CpXC protein